MKIEPVVAKKRRGHAGRSFRLGPRASTSDRYKPAAAPSSVARFDALVGSRDATWQDPLYCEYNRLRMMISIT
jgi:hypothetical protein